MKLDFFCFTSLFIQIFNPIFLQIVQLDNNRIKLFQLNKHRHFMSFRLSIDTQYYAVFSCILLEIIIRTDRILYVCSPLLSTFSSTRSFQKVCFSFLFHVLKISTNYANLVGKRLSTESTHNFLPPTTLIWSCQSFQKKIFTD